MLPFQGSNAAWRSLEKMVSLLENQSETRLPVMTGKVTEMSKKNQNSVQKLFLRSVSSQVSYKKIF